MKKHSAYRLTLLFAAICPLVAACHAARAGEAGGRIEKIADLNGRRIGAIVGTSLDVSANNALDFTQIEYYEKREQQLEALLSGEIDAYIEDEPVARYDVSVNPELRLLPGRLEDDLYGFAVRFDEKDLKTDIDKVLKNLEEDGTLADMEARWIDGVGEGARAMPELPKQTTGRILRFGVSSISPPFCYSDDEGVKGFDIELMERIAAALGRRLVIMDMDFADLIASLLSGKVDVVGSCFSITAERARIILYSESYYNGGVVAMVRADQAATP